VTCARHARPHPWRDVGGDERGTRWQEEDTTQRLDLPSVPLCRCTGVRACMRCPPALMCQSTDVPVRVCSHAGQVDISQVVVAQMQLKHSGFPNMEYVCADCRDMPCFRDCSFSSALDKGAQTRRGPGERRGGGDKCSCARWQGAIIILHCAGKCGAFTTSVYLVVLPHVGAHGQRQRRGRVRQPPQRPLSPPPSLESSLMLHLVLMALRRGRACEDPIPSPALSSLDAGPPTGPARTPAPRRSCIRIMQRLEAFLVRALQGAPAHPQLSRRAQCAGAAARARPAPLLSAGAGGVKTPTAHSAGPWTTPPQCCAVLCTQARWTRCCAPRTAWTMCGACCARSPGGAGAV